MSLREPLAAVLAAAFGLVVLASAASAHDRHHRYDRHHRGEVVVDAPTTYVRTNRRRTRVQVDAPFTVVDVDTRRRRVRIRVPFYDGVVRW